MNARFLYISGTDGSGKTTLCNQYIKILNGFNYRTNYVWMRFPHLFSLILLFYCRLTGLTKYKKIGGQYFGKWEFYRSPFICAVLPWLLLLDIIIRIFYKIYFPALLGRYIVCDRFIIDILVDLMVSTKNFKLHKQPIGKLYMKLIPKKSKIIILDVNSDVLVKRRDDLSHDELLSEKVKAFRLIAEEYNINMIDANNYVNADWRVIQCLTAK